MASLMTRSVILFLYLAITAQCKAEGLQTTLADFLYFQNGDFDNFDSAEDKNQDTIRLICKPVSIPVLQKDPVYYQEEIITGKTYRRFVAVRNESSTDRTLYLTYYNITIKGHYEPGTFNTDDLANLTRKDFQTNKDCTVFIQKVSPQTIVAEWADCRHTENGQHPAYGETITCDTLLYEVPLAADETSALPPYSFNRRGPRFPMISVPEGYFRPCQDGQ